MLYLRPFKGVLYGLIAVLLGITSYIVWHASWTPKIVGENSISAVEKLMVNGHEHAIIIRSHDYNSSPILLCLHGGPGGSDIPYIHQTNSELERRFIVVTYDQRSAGKSCGAYDDSPLTISGHVNDAVAIAEDLLGRFNRSRLCIMGGSWGSILALLIAQRRPDIVHKVVVRGLVVDSKQNERLSFDFTLARLRELEAAGVTEAAAGVAALEAMEPPPYHDRVSDLILQRKWLYVVGGMSHSCGKTVTKRVTGDKDGGKGVDGKDLRACSSWGLKTGVARAVIGSPEISLSEATRFESCLKKTLQRMWPELETFNATEQIPRLEVPLLVLHGRHDWCTVSQLVEGYIEGLEAPAGKRLVWFEQSGHSPQREEAERFQAEVMQYLLDN